MRVGIIYFRYLDEYGKYKRIGGIETYIDSLCKLCIKEDMNPIIFQCSLIKFKRIIDGVEIIGIPILNKSINDQKKELFKYASKYLNLEKDILIFGSDNCSIKTAVRRSISIQHGISWDLPSKYSTNHKILTYGIGAKYKKIILNKRAIEDFNNCPNRVCVDYNFINWFKTIESMEIKNVWIVPNYCSMIANENDIKNKFKKNDKIKILYARRFTEYRGIQIAINTAQEILKLYDNVEFTFAGEGSEENKLRDIFKQEKRVNIIKYLPAESLKIHLDHNIAIIPSIGSEGTSLSVAEAMGAGCGIIASAVGGITNMIIDGYNGILINPDHNSLKNNIIELIENKNKLQELSLKAYESALKSFNKNRWDNKWLNIINIVSTY